MTKKTLKYFINTIVALVLFSGLMGQDSLGRKHFLRVNIDLASPTYSYFFDKDNQRMGYEAMVEYSYNDTLFFIAEGGFHQLHCNSSASLYESSVHGEFLRLGINYNLMKYYNRKDRDIFYVGGRLSSSYYNMNYSSININESYWGDQQLAIPLQYYWGFWAEAVVGMRIETAKNLFLGWDLRMPVKLYDSNQSAYNTLFIPGYGNAQNKVSLWMNYSVGYAF